LTSIVSRLSLPTAGVVVGTVAGGAAACAVWTLVRDISGQAAADRATLLFCCFPAAFVLSMPYSEGVAIAAAAWSLTMAHRRLWIWAGVLGGLATASRPSTIALVAALVAAAALAHDRRAWWAPIGAVSGVTAVVLALWARTGLPDAWLRSERLGWHDGVDWGATLVRRIGLTFTGPAPSTASTGLVNLTCACGAAAMILLIIALFVWRPPLAVTVFGLGAMAFAAASMVAGTRPRMLLGAFPLVLAGGVTLRGRSYAAVLVLSAAALVTMSWITFTTLGVAP
jgi:hypothetical protein